MCPSVDCRRNRMPRRKSKAPGLIQSFSGSYAPSNLDFHFRSNEKMFVGHYSVAFAARTERNKIPLWDLIVAVQLLDFLWLPFVFLGLEKVRIALGITATPPLDLYYMPYTHSLIGALVWSALAACVYKLVRRAKGSSSAALIIALAVFSHWILDLIVHRPDLPIYD